MKRVLFDSDVLLDVLMQRQTFFLASAQVLEFVAKEQVSGYVSGHAATNIFYVLRRSVGSDVARSLILRLLEKAAGGRSDGFRFNCLTVDFL